MQKGLLILFGLYRNFDDISPQVISQFEGFDVIVSTWDYDYGPSDDCATSITEKRILKSIPFAKKIIISDFYKYNIYHYNTANMVFHWRNALNSIENLKEYDVVVLQRMDLLCNTKVILDTPIEKNCLYLETDGSIQTGWCNDFIFVGDVPTIKNFVESWPEPTEYKKYFDEIGIGKSPHFPIGHIIKSNNIKFEEISNYFKKLWFNLMKWKPGYGENYITKYNINNIKFFDLEPDVRSKIFKKMYNEITASNIGNKNYLNIKW